MHIWLKIKYKEISQEARYNKQEQLKCARKARKAELKGRTRQAAYSLKQMYSMREHLVQAVRPEARFTNIARGFLAGHEYSNIERWTYTRPDWDRIWAMVKFFHESWTYEKSQYQSLEERWFDWQQRADAYCDCFLKADDEKRKLIIRKVCPLPEKKPYVRETVVDEQAVS